MGNTSRRRGNGSGRGPTPPDIDAIIRDIQNKINKFLPGGSKSGGKPIGLNLNYFTFCMACKWTL